LQDVRKLGDVSVAADEKHGLADVRLVIRVTGAVDVTVHPAVQKFAYEIFFTECRQLHGVAVDGMYAVVQFVMMVVLQPFHAARTFHGVLVQ
jgi:hypothetical protein